MKMSVRVEELKRVRHASESKSGRGRQRQVIGPDVISWHSDKETVVNLRR